MAQAADIFVYGTGSEFDLISDFDQSGGVFNHGEYDRIDLRSFTAVNSIADLTFTAGTFTSGTFTAGAGPDLRITGFGGGAALFATGVTTGVLTDSDFIFHDQIAITVQTPDGYNFGTLYDDMAGSVGAISIVDGSHFTATNSTRGLIFNITVSGDTTPGDPLTGTVNAIDIYDLSGHILANTNGWNVLASALNSALQTYAGDHSQTAGLDAIFGTVSYSAVGNFVGDQCLQQRFNQFRQRHVPQRCRQRCIQWIEQREWRLLQRRRYC